MQGLPLIASGRTPTPLIARCGACGLYKTCRTPKMPVHGKGRRGVMVVGESPGHAEDDRGVPFVGASGQYLRDALRAVGVDLDRDCWTTNALICRAPKGTEVKDAVAHCRPNVLAAIKQYQPHTILLVGGRAMESVIGHAWKESLGPAERWVGWNIPDHRLNAWICPTYRPKDILQARHKEQEVMGIWFRRHVAAAFEHGTTPWKSSPDWQKKVDVIVSPDDAAVAINQLVTDAWEWEESVAFDYECDRLKPDHPDARILTVAISNGKQTVSAPWHGPVIEVMRNVLRDRRLAKIAHNAKFEDRWTRRQLGTPIRNLLWCTMLAAHVLDNRPGITGLKFQGYARLGQPSYDDGLKPYMSAAGSNTRNELHKLPIRTLLEYGGLDALLTWKLAKIQREELGFIGGDE